MEKVYRTVIIDDEESAIDNLCFELQRYSYISVEGKAKTGTLGLKIIERVRPDLVFLDVELPDMLGMDVVARLEGYVSWNMKIVFYTAHDRYVIDAVFSKFGIRVSIKINNRKILTGIAEIIGEADKIVDITVAIDKLDKIGLENVNAELASKGIPQEAIDKLQPIILLSGSNEEKLETLKSVLAASETGLKGVEESEFILKTISTLGIKSEVELDLTLARGLNYYTGAIFEVKALDVQIGSISGGGRYDNLTGVFGMDGMSGVGISFGADRIYDVLNQLDLYPEDASFGTQLLFVNFGEAEAAYVLPVLAKVRAAGIRAEIYPDSAKMKKQMSYANAKAIPFVAIVGENEMNEGKVMLKNMATGEQNLLAPEELIAAIR